MDLKFRKPDESFGKYVRRLIRDADLLDKEFAQRAGLKPTALSRILNGGSPSWETAEAIMKTLGIRLVQGGDELPVDPTVALLVFTAPRTLKAPPLDAATYAMLMEAANQPYGERAQAEKGEPDAKAKKP